MPSSIMLIVLFHIIVIISLIVDFKFSHGGRDGKLIKSSCIWTSFWIFLSLVFSAIIFAFEGLSSTLDFLTAYTLEKALSVDNLFVFLLIFEKFSLSDEEERRILFWGVMGSIVLRVIFIFAGLALFGKFSWLFYIFGIVLVVAGVKMLIAHSKEEDTSIEEPRFVTLCRKFLPMTRKHGLKLVTTSPRFAFTPLFIVFMLVAWTDIIFAIDSIPAVLSITQSSFIAYTSNIFAILGLRSLFFVIRSFKERFKYIQLSVGVITVFIGFKMLLLNIYHIPISISLGFIVLALLVGALASLSKNHRSV